MTGMIEGFFGFEIFNSGIFWVRKFGKYFFVWLDLSGDLRLLQTFMGAFQKKCFSDTFSLVSFCGHVFEW